MSVVTLDGDHVGVVVEVLCASFHDYPVMRFVLGPRGGDYDERLRTLVHFFVMARVLREEVLLGVRDGNGYGGVALLSRPSGESGPPELGELRDRVWAALGSDARARYEAFGAACAAFDTDDPHLHLNMIGVRPSSQGSGLGRKMLEWVHALSASDPDSGGVTLTTESESNVALYQAFGYSIVGHAVVAPGLQTWGFFRPD